MEFFFSVFAIKKKIEANDSPITKVNNNNYNDNITKMSSTCYVWFHFEKLDLCHKLIQL